MYGLLGPRILVKGIRPLQALVEKINRSELRGMIDEVDALRLNRLNLIKRGG